MATQIKSEDATEYNAGSLIDEDSIIKQALSITAGRMRKVGAAITDKKAVEAHLRIKFANLEYEVFSVLFLDNKHRVIELKELFRGTLAGASVYPREVAKEALSFNAAAVILVHNHPTGIPEPSMADKQITKQLQTTLNTVDIRVLDHIIVGDGTCVSFAERGLI